MEALGGAYHSGNPVTVACIGALFKKGVPQ
mgnify:CR=1 FL=1